MVRRDQCLGRALANERKGFVVDCGGICALWASLGVGRCNGRTPVEPEPIDGAVGVHELPQHAELSLFELLRPDLGVLREVAIVARVCVIANLDAPLRAVGGGV